MSAELKADAKQVFRFSKTGQLRHDVIATYDEHMGGAEPRLKTVVMDGRIVEPLPSLGEIRELFREEFNHLDEKYKALREPDIYPVHISPHLQNLKEQIEGQVLATEFQPVWQRVRDLGES